MNTPYTRYKQEARRDRWRYYAGIIGEGLAMAGAFVLVGLLVIIMQP